METGCHWIPDPSCCWGGILNVTWVCWSPVTQSAYIDTFCTGKDATHWLSTGGSQAHLVKRVKVGPSQSGICTIKTCMQLEHAHIHPTQTCEYVVLGQTSRCHMNVRYEQKGKLMFSVRCYYFYKDGTGTWLTFKRKFGRYSTYKPLQVRAIPSPHSAR